MQKLSKIMKQQSDPNGAPCLTIILKRNVHPCTPPLNMDLCHFATELSVKNNLSVCTKVGKNVI